MLLYIEQSHYTANSEHYTVYKITIHRLMITGSTRTKELDKINWFCTEKYECIVLLGHSL